MSNPAATKALSRLKTAFETAPDGSRPAAEAAREAPGLLRVTEAYVGLCQGGWNLEDFQSALVRIEGFAMSGLEQVLEAHTMMQIENTADEALVARSVDICALLVTDLQRMQLAASDNDRETLDQAYQAVREGYQQAGLLESATRERQARNILHQLNNETGW